MSRAGVVLDAGLFIAVERRDRVAVQLVDRFARERTPLVTSAGVVARVWRGGAGAQVPVVFLLRRTEVADLTGAMRARSVASSGTPGRPIRSMRTSSCSRASVAGRC